MANIDARPYWMYDAVGDSRTRPAHSAIDGLVYRYDDPFWATFYPPNGYNCRCSVIALSERDVERQGRIVGQSTADNLVETHKIYNKKGDSYPTTAYKAPDGSLYTADKGFGYNAGRMNYRPDLDKYDRALAHQFAKAEMGGADFKTSFKQLEKEFYEVKQRLNIDGKPDKEQKIKIRNALSRQLKFAAGVLSKEMQELAGMTRATVWLSDDTLVKQVDSREGQNFDDSYYAFLPDMLQNPEHVIRDNRELIFTARYKGSALWAVLKYIKEVDEIYLQSYRISNDKEIAKFMAKKKVLK
ncbi:TPA: phage minor head protein [Neisseria meningitidis]